MYILLSFVPFLHLYKKRTSKQDSNLSNAMGAEGVHEPSSPSQDLQVNHCNDSLTDKTIEKAEEIELYNYYFYLFKAELILDKNELSIEERIDNCKDILFLAEKMSKFEENAKYLNIKGDILCLERNLKHKNNYSCLRNAVTFYKKSLLLKDDANISVKVAKALIEMGNMDEGWELLKQLKSQQTKRQILIEEIHRERKDNRNICAALLIEKLIEIDPTVNDNYYQVLKLYNQEKAYQKAIDRSTDYLEIPEINKDKINIEVGFAKCKLEMYQSAIATCEVVNQNNIEPEDLVRLLQVWSFSLLEMKHLEIAENKIKKAINLQIELSDSIGIFASILCQKNKYEEALEQYRKLNDEDMIVLQQKAVCYLEAGDYRSSFLIIDKLLEIRNRIDIMAQGDMTFIIPTELEIKNSRGDLIKISNVDLPRWSSYFFSYINRFLKICYRNLDYQIDVSLLVSSLVVHRRYVKGTIEAALEYSLSWLDFSSVQRSNNWLNFLKINLGNEDIGRNNLYVLENVFKYIETKDEIWLKYLSINERKYVKRFIK